MHIVNVFLRGKSGICTGFCFGHRMYNDHRANNGEHNIASLQDRDVVSCRLFCHCTYQVRHEEDTFSKVIGTVVVDETIAVLTCVSNQLKPQCVFPGTA
jgi:hypothetical protein